MNFDDTIAKIQEKIGEESSALIADDIASLITYESARNKDIKEKEDKINKLTKDKEMLIEANGTLLQQVSAEKEDILDGKNQDVEEKKPINIKSAFDKFGNFIK